MTIRRFRTIYLFCPAGVRTGGPEALHQLGRALRDMGHDAQLVYTHDMRPAVDGSRLSFPELDDPMPAAYARYDVPRTFTVHNEPDRAFVTPEIWPESVRIINRAAGHLWWLSIDHGMQAIEAFGGIDAIQAAPFVHLCQSYYALAYLAARGLSGLPLFDYTSPEHTALESMSETERGDRVLFPSRGAWFTARLQRRAPDLNWQEIKGFTPDEVRKLFQTSKLYVDFGKHPGKDRMPREAAIHGCCVITGRRGAAENPYDIPIPARYKFDDTRWQIPAIVRAIRAVLDDYPSRVSDFSMYRRMIGGEQPEFLAQVARIFGGQLAPAPAE